MRSVSECPRTLEQKELTSKLLFSRRALAGTYSAEHASWYKLSSSEKIFWSKRRYLLWTIQIVLKNAMVYLILSQFQLLSGTTLYYIRWLKNETKRQRALTIIGQSSPDSVTYIKFWMYDNTSFASPLSYYVMRQSCLPSGKLALAKTDLKK